MLITFQTILRGATYTDRIEKAGLSHSVPVWVLSHYPAQLAQVSGRGETSLKFLWCGIRSETLEAHCK